MNRFLVEKINLTEKYVILNDPEQLHHFRDVLRIRPSEEVAVFDHSGNEYLAVVLEVGLDRAKLRISQKRAANHPSVEITVACAIPKNVKMDEIIDKLTQLGVVRIIPLQTERVVVRLDKQKKLQRFQRWEKIALSAVKQSQRSRLLELEPISEFDQVVKNAMDFDLKLIPTLGEERKTLKEIFSQTDQLFRKIMILIGPEGDFTPREVSLAKLSGFLPVSLGKQVLRVDTAAIAAVSFIKLNAQD